MFKQHFTLLRFLTLTLCAMPSKKRTLPQDEEMATPPTPKKTKATKPTKNARAKKVADDEGKLCYWVVY